MVSDNATIFTSNEFKQYCTSSGIFQKLIAPGHAATNGLAERNVQTLKQRLKAAETDSTPLNIKLQEILFRYRATPLACGKSPSELYLNRQIRTRLDALRPYHPAPNQISSCRRSVKVGERVQVRDHQNNKDFWRFGTVTEKLGVLHYTVLLDTGRSIKRHIDKIHRTLVKKVRFDTTDQEMTTPANPAPQLPIFERAQISTPNLQSTDPPSTTIQQQPSPQNVPPFVQPSQSTPRAAQESSNFRRSSRVRRQPEYLQHYVPE